MTDNLSKWFSFFDKEKNNENELNKEIKKKNTSDSFRSCETTYTNYSTLKSAKNKINKTVSFNPVVSIVKVESYKRYYYRNSYINSNEFSPEEEKCFGCLLI